MGRKEERAESRDYMRTTQVTVCDPRKLIYTYKPGTTPRRLEAGCKSTLSADFSDVCNAMCNEHSKLDVN